MHWGCLVANAKKKWCKKKKEGRINCTLYCMSKLRMQAGKKVKGKRENPPWPICHQGIQAEALGLGRTVPYLEHHWQYSLKYGKMWSAGRRGEHFKFVSFHFTGCSFHFAPDTEWRTTLLHLCSAFTLPYNELGARKDSLWKPERPLVNDYVWNVPLLRSEVNTDELSYWTRSEQTHEPRPRTK